MLFLLFLLFLIFLPFLYSPKRRQTNMLPPMRIIGTIPLHGPTQRRLNLAWLCRSKTEVGTAEMAKLVR